MKKLFYSIIFLLDVILLFGQNYMSFHIGNKMDTVTKPKGGICMMGGSTEHDNAMRWFLRQANGGDVVVLRASGADGYNEYMYSTLGVPVNSVETIFCGDFTTHSEAYIHQKIKQAEAIWFAGGDQWKYISFWRKTAIDSLINEAIKERNIVIGGTSAGMAIQGKFYFGAPHGGVTSRESLANPFHNAVVIDSLPFIKNRFLEHVITDSHFDERNRKGRLLTFLARIANGYGINGKAIACDEKTAVCISPNGMAQVYGGDEEDDHFAYFVQSNPTIRKNLPETCKMDIPITWHKNEKALLVYKVKGTENGNNTFDLNDWITGRGGMWLHWSAKNGQFLEKTALDRD